MAEQVAEELKAKGGRKPAYVIDLPANSRGLYWWILVVAVICMAIPFPAFLSGGFTMAGWMTLAIILILAPGVSVTLVLVDFLITVPLALHRSVQLPSNLELIKERSLWDFLIKLHAAALKYNGRKIVLWVVPAIAVITLITMGIEPDNVSESILMGVTLIAAAAFAWLFVLESGIMASMIGPAPGLSVSVLLFWIIPVVIGGLLRSNRLGDDLAVKITNYQVGTGQYHYGSGLWTNPGAIMLIFIAFCGLMVVAWLVTAIVSVVLFRRFVRKKMSEMGMV